ncbi:hypothetical protein FHS35_002728 [Streptomyces umbrinus]|uniref:hypothetical protein n=1 Tax=Streptomyces umbrinus TaxID=67370 RepID=UPI00167D7B91|nr:hypothetical protein [Streptomyces umbrinus]MCR3725880.1 hypothetical protein [Streptomyces umbrinus]GHH49585.1 hypothetical protein GCM10018775_45560 [Streptomyces umbrinus]
MEQRIGPNIQPLQGAAVDPAFVPGITGPRPAEPKDAEPTEAVSEETASEEETAPEKRKPAKQTDLKKEAAEEAPSDDEPSTDEPSGEDSSSEKPEEREEPAAEPEEAPEGGPVFEASDRRAKIVADHSGVRLSLDDQEAEFRWEEIGAVETESPRFGKRFTITVHTPDRRWYPIEIEASARSRFKEWETQLDEVLDTYFEDAEEVETEAEAEAEVETEVKADAEVEAEAEAEAEAKAEAAPEEKKTP